MACPTFSSHLQTLFWTRKSLCVDTQALSPSCAPKWWPLGQPQALGVHTPAVQCTLREEPREKSTQGLEGTWAIWATIFKAGYRRGAWVGHPTLDPTGPLPEGGPLRDPWSSDSRAEALVTCVWGQHCTQHCVFMFRITFSVLNKRYESSLNKELTLWNWEFGAKRIED